MSQPLSFQPEPNDRELARLYRLQVRELSDCALFAIALDGRIVTWNRGVEAAFGYREDEWIGQHLDVIFTPEDRAAGVPDEEMRTAAEEGRADDVRWHMRKDGARVYMYGVLRALRGENGSLIGYSKILFDETSRKRLSDALSQSNRDLEQFAFVASHDLQEPLHTINAFAAMLRDRCADQGDVEADRMITYLVEATRRMSALVEDLLAFSRVAREESKATSVYLDEDLDTAITLLRNVVELNGAVITHGPLPNVQCDRNLMVRLFQNLLSNALKFRKPDVPPRIHVSAERRDREWMIRVVDNGIGFPPEEGEAIFAPFRRLHSTDDYAGSGIGLAVCQRIVERLGGRIGAEGRPGEGATVWFTLPLPDADRAPQK